MRKSVCVRIAYILLTLAMTIGFASAVGSPLSGTGLSAFAEGGGYGRNGKFLAPIDAPDTSAIKISTRADLEKIGIDPAYPRNGSYVLTDDIDLKGGEWTPIGTGENNAFKGVLDGQGYVVQNLRITEEKYQYNGLFGFVIGAEIKNLGLEGTYINIPAGSSLRVGGICGYARIESLISNCYNAGNVSVSGTSSYVGGICGRFIETGSIDHCYNTGNISAITDDGSVAGGVVGNMSNSSIRYCNNAGNIFSNSSAGGICGIASTTASFYDISISHCYNRGNVSSKHAASGICSSFSGHKDSSISYCYNAGNISAANNSVTSNESGYAGAGGICYLFSGYGNSSISFCYNIGDISASAFASQYSLSFFAYAGGIVGDASASSNVYDSLIKNCYNSGDVISSASSVYAYSKPYAGGIIGNMSNGSISFCYNTGEVSSFADCFYSSSTLSPDSYAGGIAGHFYAYASSPNLSSTRYCIVISTSVHAENTNEKGKIYSHLIGYTERGEKSNNLALSGNAGNAVDDADGRITPAQAQLQSAYENLGWDFDTVWKMVPGYSYPQLQWQTEYAGDGNGGDTSKNDTGNFTFSEKDGVVVADSITFNGKTVNAYYRYNTNTHAYDDDNDSLKNYTEIYEGLGYSYALSYGLSCASLVKRFYKEIYGAEINGLEENSVPYVSNGFGNLSKVSTPQTGDIVSENNGKHWMIVKSVDGNVVTVIEQNYLLSAGKTVIGRKISVSGSGHYFYRYTPRNPVPDMAHPTTSSIFIDGKLEDLGAYNINGNNYFKLRDLAFVLNGTKKQFNIDWNSSANEILLTSGQPYIPVGGEMSGIGDGVKIPVPTSANILLDFRKIRFTAYNIEGNNYFKLRDVAAALDFGVTWDGAAQRIMIDTGTGYTPE